MGKTLGKIKTFFKPNKKKIAISALTAATLAFLALCYNIGYKESNIRTFVTSWDGDFPDVHYIVEYNPIFYPISHLIGHAKDEFVVNLPSLYALWRRWPPPVDYVISQFIWNIPYYLGVGYVVGCSVVEGTKRVARIVLAHKI